MYVYVQADIILKKINIYDLLGMEFRKDIYQENIGLGFWFVYIYFIVVFTLHFRYSRLYLLRISLVIIKKKILNK